MGTACCESTPSLTCSASMAPAGTPAAEGFKMPAEWEPHSGCWMGWPDRPDNWRENAKPGQRAFAEVASAISRFEPVTVCCNSAQWVVARAALPDSIRVVELAINDSWFRDTAPIFLVKATDDQAASSNTGPGALRDEDGAGAGANGHHMVVNGGSKGMNGSVKESPASPGGVRSPYDRPGLAVVDFRFNGYGGEDGGCYLNYEHDRLVAHKIAGIERVRRFSHPMVLEGGSIHVDGEGTLLTTEECLLHRNRNAHMSKAEIERELRHYLNVDVIIWLPWGLYGDEDTNGHIDNICCFVRPGVVLLAWTDDPEDPQWERSQAALRVLESSRDAKGRTLQVIKLPVPPRMCLTEEDVAGLQETVDMPEPRKAGTVMAASYINFYIANGAIIAPAFGHAESDARAGQILRDAFPEREIVQIPSRDILLGGGNIHCITQQQPAGRC
eukprot:jgi/Mesvir1/5448/Mv15505-RA.1